MQISPTLRVGVLLPWLQKHISDVYSLFIHPPCPSIHPSITSTNPVTGVSMNPPTYGVEDVERNFYEEINSPFNKNFIDLNSFSSKKLNENVLRRLHEMMLLKKMKAFMMMMLVFVRVVMMTINNHKFYV